MNLRQLRRHITFVVDSFVIVTCHRLREGAFTHDQRVQIASWMNLVAVALTDAEKADEEPDPSPSEPPCNQSPLDVH